MRPLDDLEARSLVEPHCRVSMVDAEAARRHFGEQRGEQRSADADGAMIGRDRDRQSGVSASTKPKPRSVLENRRVQAAPIE
jgi:hypothetical protein